MLTPKPREMKSVLIILGLFLLVGCKPPEGSTYFIVTKVVQSEDGVKYICYQTTPPRTGVRTTLRSDSVYWETGDTIYLKRINQ